MYNSNDVLHPHSQIQLDTSTYYTGVLKIQNKEKHTIIFVNIWQNTYSKGNKTMTIGDYDETNNNNEHSFWFYNVELLIVCLFNFKYVIFSNRMLYLFKKNLL